MGLIYDIENLCFVQYMYTNVYYNGLWNSMAIQWSNTNISSAMYIYGIYILYVLRIIAMQICYAIQMVQKRDYVILIYASQNGVIIT